MKHQNWRNEIILINMISVTHPPSGRRSGQLSGSPRWSRLQNGDGSFFSSLYPPPPSKVNSLFQVFGIPVINVLWTIVAGQRFNFANPKAQRLMELLNRCWPQHNVRRKVFDKKNLFQNRSGLKLDPHYLILVMDTIPVFPLPGFVFLPFDTCPGQLNRWSCHWISDGVSQWHVLFQHCRANETHVSFLTKIKTKTKTKTKTTWTTFVIFVMFLLT